MTPRLTAAQVSAAVIAQLETSLSTTIPLLPKSFCRVLAKVIGGVFVLLFNFAGWSLLQMFPKTASNEDVTVNGVTINPLRTWGSMVGIYQDLGVKAERTIEISVLITGGSLTSGTRLVNTATQMTYVLVGDVSLSSSTVTGVARATEPGDAGNIDTGETLEFQSPPSTIEKEATVTAASPVLGTDPETTEVFRKHVLDRFAARPQGGAYADYRDWGQSVAGVKAVYPYSGWSTNIQFPTGGPGYVFVYVESIADTDGIPQQAMLDDVADAIEMDGSGLATRRNINARVNVYPITRTSIDVTVRGLAFEEDRTELEDAIEDALEEYLLDREPFILGLNTPPRKDVITTSSIGGVVAFVAQAMGGAFTDIVMTVGGSDLMIYTLDEGEKCKLGNLTIS